MFREEPGDANRDGDGGTVLGSIKHEGVIVYFVEWDRFPRSATAVLQTRVSYIA